jgi:glucokinase
MKEVAIGIDVGGTNTAFGIIDREGNILASDTIDTQIHEDVNLFVRDLTDAVNNLLASVKDISLKGIGVGAPNGNFFQGTIEFAPNLRWKGIVPLAKMIKDKIDVPVLLTNDANAAAIGEMIYGAAKGMKDFIVITLGTGLGSGIVSNGQLIYGHDGFAGEIGHVIVDPNGRQCGCGRKGCLETYASATGLVKTVNQFLEERQDESSLRKLTKDQITSKKIYDAALAGDKLALEAFDYTCKILGFTLANSVAYTSPEAIILFGGLALAKEFMYDATKKYMEENLLQIFQNKVKIIQSTIPENHAAILGGSALIWGTQY